MTRAQEPEWEARLCRYRAALDAAVATQQVEIVASLLEELAARSGLASALGVRSPLAAVHLNALSILSPCKPSIYLSSVGAHTGKVGPMSEGTPESGTMMLPDQVGGTRTASCLC